MEFPKNWVPIFFCFADVYVIASQIAIKMLKWSRYVEIHMRQVRNCENKGEELMAELAQVIKYEGDTTCFAKDRLALSSGLLSVLPEPLLPGLFSVFPESDVCRTALCCCMGSQ